MVLEDARIRHGNAIVHADGAKKEPRLFGPGPKCGLSVKGRKSARGY
jgi:hypothetical protein